MNAETDNDSQQAIPDAASQNRLMSVFHDSRDPFWGLQNNIHYLRHHWDKLDHEKINRKLTDMQSDVWLASFYHQELEYIMLGVRPSIARIETLMSRYIVEVINMLVPVVRRYSLDSDRIRVIESDACRIRLKVDRDGLRHVVSTLLLNAVGRSVGDPSKFEIRVDFDIAHDKMTIQWADWGMGFGSDDQKSIFVNGYRSQADGRSAFAWLDLHIARQMMLAMGGDLLLAKNEKPTVFQMILPRLLEEAPNDRISR